MPTTPQIPAHPMDEKFRLAGVYSAEIDALTGCGVEVAQMAANSFLTFPSDIGRWGLSEGAFTTTEAMARANKARAALKAWVAEHEARIAADAQKAAA